MKIILVLALVCFEIIKSCTYNQNIPDKVLPPQMDILKWTKPMKIAMKPLTWIPIRILRIRKMLMRMIRLYPLILLMWNGVSLNGLKMTT